MPSLPSNAVVPLPDWPDERLAGLDDAALEAAARTRVTEALERAREVYPGLPAPGVWFDLKGASAGQAHLGRGGLRFNPVLLRENRAIFFAEVIPHELAHWLVFHLQDGPRLKPHGREWQAVMRELFALVPRVTHRLDVSRARPAPYRYRCRCGDHHFTPQRHAQRQKGRRYRCRQCADTLVYCGRDAAREYL